MYKIICDTYTLHNVNMGLMVIDAKCKLEVNKTGSLTFYVAQNHPYRNFIKKLNSEITLYQDDKALFYGRVLNNEIDINGLMLVECEGELSYLLDTIQRANEYDIDGGSKNAVEIYLKMLISNHNNQVSSDKQFVVGSVNVTDSNNHLYPITNYENTLTVINDDLIKKFGGYIQIRHQDGKRYIDYLNESSTTSIQKIEFGKNIIDFTQTINGEGIYTALIPLGAKSDNSSSEVEKRLTIRSINDSTVGNIVKKSDYIYDSEAVKKYGYIFRVEKWDDVKIPTNLLKKAKEKLSQHTSESMYLELTAIDLHSLDTNIDSFEVGNKIRCVSKPHNIDTFLIVKSIDIDIDNPANTSIKLTQTFDSISDEKKSLTDKNDDANKKVDKIENTVKERTPTDSDLDKKVSDLKKWTDDTINGNNDTLFYNNKSPIKYWVSNEISDNNDTLFNNDNSTIKDWVRNNFPSSTADLSAYAKIADVNTAFNQLATAIEGV